ncbi:MAG TPA: dephospho-CoA kinase [Longimicrobiales bacterium]
MFRVGLTGNIAAGKSTVARVWARLGAPVIDADVLARRAVEPGSAALRRIAATFGPGVIGADGALDRAALRRIVFRDPAARARLEAIVHPEVARLRREEEARLRDAGVRLVVYDVPLLFEAGLERDFDVVVLVDAPPDVRLQRLVRDRGLAEDEARRMIEAQMPATEKRGRADYVIDNDGTLEELERQAEDVWWKVRRRAGESG